MGVSSENSTVKHTFEHNGKVYKLNRVKQEFGALFEMHQLDKAKQAAAFIKDLMEPHEYQKHLLDLNDRFATEYYSIEAYYHRKAMGNVESLLLLSLIFGVDTHEMTNLVLERKDDVMAIFNLIMRESYPSIFASADAKKKTLTTTGQITKRITRTSQPRKELSTQPS